MLRIRPTSASVPVALLALLALTQPAQAADALNGKTLYLNGPTSGGTSCSACHGPSPAANVNGILAAANNPAVITNAFAANRGGMGTLFNGKFSAAEIEDLAAFIGNPNVTPGPTASVAPASLSFAGTTVGQSSAALATTLSNTGSAALNITAIALGGSAPGDYSITGGTCAGGGSVAAGSSCTVQVVFRPTAAGARSASLTISHNATGGSSSVGLSGTGNAVAQPSIGVSANAVDFGALLTGAASTEQTLTVSNNGQAPLAFSAISLGGPQAAYFTLGGSCATQTPVAAGASCTVTVRAQPASAGAFSGTLTLASNASNGNVAVSLSGTASAAAPALAANPSALAFGSQAVGGAATTQTVTLSNTGNVPLNFTAITVTGAASITLGSGGTCGATLAQGASCTVALSFAPTAQGNVAATLVVRSNAPELQVAVTGSGTTAAAARPTLSNAGPLAYADTQVGQATAAQRITLTNEGSAALKIGSLVLGGSHAGDFTLGGSCTVGATVSPGANCTLEPAFKPTAAGARSADLVLVTDGGVQFSVRLGGNGVAVAGMGALSANPASFDFDAVTLGANASKRFVLTNSGNAVLSLASASASGPFTVLVDATSCPALPFTLQPGASCELPVRFAPSVAGAASGSVVLQAANAGPSWTIALNGRGNAPAPSAQTTRNEGGGGCSAARDGRDPTLAGLVLLAAGVLLWRRRQARLLAAAAALALSAQAGALEVGKPAPPFALSGPAGTVKLEQHAGKLVYVDFWASWCGPCRQSFPWMNEMQAKYGPRGFQVIGISVDAKPEEARSFLASTPARFIVAFDPSGATPRSYGIKGMPSSVLVGPDGKVVYEHSGFRPADKAELERRIQLALGSKP